MSAGLGALCCTAQAGIFEDARSMDPTPIDIEMAGAHYRIPRNYLFQMDNWRGGPQELVSLRVFYPGFKPLGPDTKDCNHARCRIYEVALLDRYTTTEESPINQLMGSNSKVGKAGPYGFRLYEQGPDNGRIEYYRKIVDGKSIMFYCLLNKTSEDDAVCHHVARTRSGATISYFFMRNKELKDAVEVDLGLRALVDSFYVGEAK
jgi:hypothetical protein